jgi:hypothetical protein
VTRRWKRGADIYGGWKAGSNTTVLSPVGAITRALRESVAAAGA